MKFEEPKMEVIYIEDVVVASSCLLDDSYEGEVANCKDGWSDNY